MKILVVYYSKTGNTKKVATDIANKLGADLEEIVDKKKRTGIFGYLLGGRDAMKKIGTQIKEVTRDPASYDLVIIGSPVWGWNVVPAVRTYLELCKGKIENYAFFVTSGNTDSQKLVVHLREITKQEPLSHVGFNAEELKDKKVYEQKISNFINFIKELKNKTKQV